MFRETPEFRDSTDSSNPEVSATEHFEPPNDLQANALELESEAEWLITALGAYESKAKLLLSGF